MTNEQTIDEIMKAAADSVLAEIAHHNMPSSLRAGVCERKRAALRHAITAALAAKDAEIERLKARLTDSGCDLQALKARPEPDEWIEWAGGECPIADDVQHQIRTRDGWTSTVGADAPGWDWALQGGDIAIVAYRVLA